MTCLGPITDGERGGEVGPALFGGRHQEPSPLLDHGLRNQGKPRKQRIETHEISKNIEKLKTMQACLRQKPLTPRWRMWTSTWKMRWWRLVY